MKLVSSSRRIFLKKSTALAVNSVTGGQTGLLGVLWSQATLPTAIPVIKFSTHQSDIAFMLKYADEFNESLKLALSHAACGSVSDFVPELDQCVQKMCFFYLKNDFDRKNWSDILSDPDYLEGIALCSEGRFNSADKVRQAIHAFQDIEFLKGVSLPGIFGKVESMVWEQLIEPHLEKLKGFDWVGYMKSLDSGDNIESVYQLLQGYGDRLPADIMRELESAYDVFSYEECVAGIQASPLRKAITFIRFFDEGAGQEKWMVERQKWTWRDYQARYKVTADEAGEAGHAELITLQQKWISLYKGKIQFEALERDEATGIVSFMVEPHENYEDEFDQLCSLSFLRKNADFLKLVRAQAEEDEKAAIAPAQTNHCLVAAPA